MHGVKCALCRLAHRREVLILDGCCHSLVAIVLKLEKSEEKRRRDFSVGSTSYSKHDRTRAVVAWEETVERITGDRQDGAKMAGKPLSETQAS